MLTYSVPDRKLSDWLHRRRCELIDSWFDPRFKDVKLDFTGYEIPKFKPPVEERRCESSGFGFLTGWLFGLWGS